MGRPKLSDEAFFTTRNRLTSCALQLYRDEGESAVSFRRLADAAGTSHTQPYRYFESKQELLVALRVLSTQNFQAFVLQRVTAASTAVGRIRRLAAAYLEFAESHPDEYLLIFSSQQPPAEFPALHAARQSIVEYAEQLVAAAADGVTAKEVRLVAHQFWVAAHGLISLHVGQQLVHGCSIDDLFEPLINSILGPHIRPVTTTD